MPFVKGHGTQNDFVLIADPDAQLSLGVETVALLCDRRAGIGGDGLIRAARAGALRASGAIAQLPDGVGDEDWFMDYRNADGGVVEMCGNGARVFAHFLRALGLEPRGDYAIGTRAGAKRVRLLSFDGGGAEVSVEMGRVRLGGPSATSVAGAPRGCFSGTSADVGNPHLVCLAQGLDLDGLAALDLTRQPDYDKAVFPEGVNIEFVVPHSPDKATLRVHERGVGETKACGTGSVAAAAVVLAELGSGSGEVVVASPGGVVQAYVGPDGSAVLRGPSALVARGEFDKAWLQQR
ncbi:diaminopimelate epimerase [Segniliparus rotundus]|uniref:diaminopimelate epimerase n=1 Tax=Segniliparus rotundus TaxID=286802 RepID=UPI00059BC1D1|nr:diaminopimelate epimerase [Segniliparus rotundus]